jgi:membrane protein YqaA with SNARE-associated domain
MADVWLGVAWLVVFLVNLMPAFMPPTWSILAFFLIQYHLPLLPLAFGGAVAATSGRYILALVSRRWGRQLIPLDQREYLTQLGRWLDAKARWAAPAAVLLYSFGPIPSNQLFIAAGLTCLPLGPIVSAFFVGRLLSYTLWAYTAHLVVRRFEDIFVGYWSNALALAVQVVLIALLILFTRINWPKLLGLPAEPPQAS